MLRDVPLSFCPASVRGRYRPASPSRVLLVAIVAGLAQTVLFTKWFLAGFFSFLAIRSHQLEPTIQRMNQTTQAWFVVVLWVEYLAFHPVGLLCAYFAVEGFIRFAGGVCASVVVPSLPVVLAFRIRQYLEDKKAQRRLAPLAAIRDSVEVFADGERLRIAASLAKENWNASLTIGIDGEWYEVEREEHGPFPRIHVYILKRAPVGKILRAYEQYDLASALKTPLKNVN
jgi:hypothetical protein